MAESSLHRWLINQLAASPVARSWKATQERPIVNDRQTNFGDILLEREHFHLLIEVETSARRVANDMLKITDLAEELGNSERIALWIVTPNQHTRLAVIRKLGRLRTPIVAPWLQVLTLSSAQIALIELDRCYFSKSLSGQ